MQDEFVTAEVRKVLYLDSKEGKGGKYFDVMFRLNKSGSYYRSCIYEHCRNFRNWKGFLEPGYILGNLKLLQHKSGKLFVDADSLPKLIQVPYSIIKSNRDQMAKQTKDIQQSLFQ